MRAAALLGGLGVFLALGQGPARAADPYLPSPVPRYPVPHGHPYAPPPGCPHPGQPLPQPGQPPPQPGAPAPEPAVPADAFAQAPEAGTQPAASFNPAMFGDLIGPAACRVVRVPGRFRTTTVTNPLTGAITTVTTPVRRTIQVPILSRGNFKVADNGSVRPLDRAFVMYNFYSDAFASTSGPGIPGSDLHRETIGFEKTFFDGNASFGLRLPFAQLTGFDQVNDSIVGDLTFILKLAVVNDPTTGNVVAGGLAVTAPTGDETRLLIDDDIHSTLLQPWGGVVLNLGNFYLHGFSSLVVPTDSDDVTVWFNDIGIGWWAYRSRRCDSFLSAVVPTAEVHVNTPLNHRGKDCPIGFTDQVNLTGGAQWVLRQRYWLGTAVVVPVVGPRPFDNEAICSLNFRF